MWRNDHAQCFHDKLQSDQSILMFNDVYNDCINDRLESAVTTLNNIIRSCASGMAQRNRPQSKSSKDAPWFDGECNDAKILMKAKLRHFRARRTDDSLDEYIQPKASFKKLCENKKLSFRISRVEALSNALESGNSREFWSFLKPVLNTSNSITLNEWYSYFKKLYNELYNDLKIPSRSDVPPTLSEVAY